MAPDKVAVDRRWWAKVAGRAAPEALERETRAVPSPEAQVATPEPPTELAEAMPAATEPAAGKMALPAARAGRWAAVAAP